MFSTGQRRLAIETFIRFDHSYADTIAELGYPTRHPLRAWHKDHLEHGEARPPKRQREPRFTLEMGQAAVGCCPAHGKSLARTMSRLGCPASRETMGDNGGDTEEKGVPVSRESGGLPDDIEVLQGMLREAKMQLRKVQLEPGVRQATLETARKTRAPTQSR